MLTYLLAIVVGLASFSLYMAAFFFPEVHRRYDLIWSGVGMFYALILWVCAERITGGLLLGQIASVALLGWFGYQTLQLRHQQTPISERTLLPVSATSPLDVVRVTVQQLRSSFRESGSRSPQAAQIERAITQLEAVWQTVRSRINALVSTTLGLPPAETDGTAPAAKWSQLKVEHPEAETIQSTTSYSPPDSSTSNSANGNTGDTAKE